MREGEKAVAPALGAGRSRSRRRGASQPVDAALYALERGGQRAPGVAVAPPLRVHVKDIAARDGLHRVGGGERQSVCVCGGEGCTGDKRLLA